MGTGLLSLTFSETAKAASVVPAELTLQNWPVAACVEAAAAGSSVQLDKDNCDAAAMGGVDAPADQALCESVQLARLFLWFRRSHKLL